MAAYTKAYGKAYKEIFDWCVESALSLLSDRLSNSGKTLGYSKINDFFGEKIADRNFPRRQISRMVYELKRREYIEIVDGDSVRLTNKAKIKIIDKFTESNCADGKYRLISFDIPESMKTNRNNFRRAIKRMGFRQVQKSLWVSRKNYGNLVEAVADEYGVSDYVAYFIVEKSNIDRHIAKILEEKL